MTPSIPRYTVRVHASTLRSLAVLQTDDYTAARAAMISHFSIESQNGPAAIAVTVTDETDGSAVATIGPVRGDQPI